MDATLTIGFKPSVNCEESNGRDFLKRNGSDRDVKSIMRCSSLASATRNAAVIVREAAFLAFSDCLSMRDILARMVGAPLWLDSDLMARSPTDVAGTKAAGSSTDSGTSPGSSVRFRWMGPEQSAQG
jgi:hypothetical protein